MDVWLACRQRARPGGSSCSGGAAETPHTHHSTRLGEYVMHGVHGGWFGIWW